MTRSVHSQLYTKAIWDEHERDWRRPWLGQVMRKGDSRPVSEKRARTEESAWRLTEHERTRMISTGIHPA